MDDIRIIHLDEVDSTNNYLHDYKGEEGRRATVVWADYQTAGRGQGSNVWRSERGKNLLMSIKVHPRDLPAARNFVMLEAGALAVKEMLGEFIGGLTIKWPNDILWLGDKISGTLSECTVRGDRVDSCVLGIGVNILQTDFPDCNTHPVSLRGITGRNAQMEYYVERLTELLVKWFDKVDEGQYDEIHERYVHSLWRSRYDIEEIHRFGRDDDYEGVPFRDAGGGFKATIEGVEPDGHLLLRRSDGTVSRYAFKEVEFIY